MFSVALPYYSEYNASRRKRSPSQTALSKSTAAGPSIENNHNHNNSSISSPQSPVNISDLLEPAVEGPPSPERLRQLSKEAKRASHLNRGHGRRAASSGSSSLLSLTGEQQPFDNMSLTRQSSIRSTTSRSSSRDRPDSVQVLGKNIFHRRAKSSKSKRDSSAHSSSGSSLYSAEITHDNTLATLKESLMPTIFSRRKPSRDESALQKKVQISGPFNFQHVTHTHRDQLVNLQRENRMDLASEFSTMRTPAPNTPGVINRPNAQDLYFPNFSSEEVNNQDVQSTAPFSRPPLLSRRTAPISGTRRLIKHARSQEQLRVSPPRPVRPPRSPIEPTSSPTLPPVPPPRVSSRQSMRQDCDPLTAASLDRPQTSGGFRRPQPFSPDETLDQPPATSHGYASPDVDDFPVDETRFSHALTTTSHVAWPLGNPSASSFDTPLPDVPEEEEQFVLTRRSRVSLASNNSSLRGSQSVPVLRALAQAQRPMSGASDTLGRVDESTDHQTYQGGHHEIGGPGISPIRESWEDDIDYCYEHEADANFNYEWERPSMDVGRDSLAPPVQVALVDDELMRATPGSTAHSSPGMLSASRFDVPALSPVSQTSTTAGHEATTPSSTLSLTNNFSFPRVEKPFRPSNLRHSRSGSQASSFKESHGFTLSPSLLIPNDYHQQMLLSEVERQEFPYDDDILTRSTGSIPYDDGSLSANHHSPLMFQSRSSVSTTTTNSTAVSDSTGERHISTNSTWTTLTRFTSSTSLNKMAGSWSETADRVPGTHLADPNDDSDQETTLPASKDTVPELTPFPAAPFGKKSLHKSHASESVVRDELPPMKSAEAMKIRRPRARTTSLSAQAPPVGQYALFPRTYVKGSGDRI
ncbi:Fc.00g006720.m01.CDS01 [Cosmosporella sp. VM-42]